MSTHNICIRREIRKILCGYPLLSVAMCSITRVIEQLHKKTYHVPSKDSLHICSLIGGLVVSIKRLSILSYPKCAQ